MIYLYSLLQLDAAINSIEQANSVIIEASAEIDRLSREIRKMTGNIS